MAANQHTALSSLGFQQPFSSFLESQLRSIDRMLGAPTLHCCEFEDEFGCGALGTITDLESEREYCAKHFRNVSLWRAVAEVSRG
ncbi:MAG: hypothetical protein JWO19_4400 [Bryobacterales bacterium]|nr:hypothetical protein [Bryobacterales bacterium]